MQSVGVVLDVAVDYIERFFLRHDCGERFVGGDTRHNLVFEMELFVLCLAGVLFPNDCYPLFEGSYQLLCLIGIHFADGFL